MHVHLLPASVQSALRVEALTTHRRIERLTAARAPSDAALMLALAASFIGVAGRSGIGQTAPVEAFEKTVKTLMSDAMRPSSDESEAAREYALTDDYVPQSAVEAVLEARGKAVRGAVPMSDVPSDTPNVETI